MSNVMHIGSYDEEPETIRKMEEYVKEAGYRVDLSEGRKHHEIYLSDPRRTAPERLKTDNPAARYVEKTGSL